MKQVKIITIISLALCLFGIANQVVHADTPANLMVQFENSPLFNEANFLPGDSVTRWIKATNNTSVAQPIGVMATNFSDPLPSDDLARALNITIKKGSTDLYGGSLGNKTLADFFAAGEIKLEDLSASANAQYDFIISFPTEKENEWQAKRTGFDIVLGIFGEPEKPPKPPVTDDPPKTYGGGGGGGGSCANEIIEGSVKVTQVTTSTATIEWRTKCVSTSQVIYSPSDKKHDLDDSKKTYGYDKIYPDPADPAKTDTHKVTLVDLKPCTTYFFRAVSTNVAAAISKEGSFVTPCVQGAEDADQGIVGKIKSYFTPEVPEEVAGIATTSNEIASGEEKNTCPKQDELPWILLAGIGGTWFYQRRERIKFQKQAEKLGIK